MKFASRMSHLGTETAYAVSAEAGTFAAAGNKVYPLHIGDINLPTPQNITKALIASLNAGNTGYCPAAGIMPLREAMAHDINKTHHTDYTWENVSIQSGGKPVIGKFLMTIMEPGDEVLYPTPGYPIYESQVDFFGGVRKPYRYKEVSDGFILDMEYFKSLITPKTKVLVYNNYHNPMGVCSSREEMEEIAKIAVKNDLMVLADEAYFDMVYDGKPLSILEFPGMKERTVILYTFSKKFSMTGWRLGAAIGPKEIIEKINKINTNDEACTTHFIQYAGIEALQGDQTEVKKILKTLEERLDVMMEELADCPGIVVHRPKATFYLFVNVTEAMKKMGITKMEEFRKHMLEHTGVSFCTREHFGEPLPGEDQKYIRFAYSGINIPQIREGLGVFKKYLGKYF
jgi:aspartate/methionine/tyrosine aminotransferase